jgi:hypothetical protein
MKRLLLLAMTLILGAAPILGYDNLATGGTASVSGATRHTGSNSVDAFFDNDVSTFYGFNAANNTEKTVYIQYAFTEAKLVNAYAIQCGPSGYWDATGRCPKNFTFQGYDEENAEWVVLDTRSNQTGWANGEMRTYQFVNTTSYKKYRLAVPTTGYMGFAELKFFYIDSRDTVKVVSDVEEWGTPTPGYGTTTGHTVGGTTTCSITLDHDVYVSAGGGHYSFAGWELYGNADTATPVLLDSGTGKTVSFTQESYSKVIWKWAQAPIRVATDGDDENDGFSGPKATIAGAVSAATVAGQVIEVADGDYAISAALSIAKDVTVRAANAGKVTVTGAGSHKLLSLNHASARVEGIVFVNGYASDDATLNQGSGVEFAAGTLSGCTVTGCESVGYGCPAVWLSGANAKVSGCTVSNNVTRKTDSNNRPYITHGGGVGLSAGLVENTLIADNRGGSSAGVWQSGGTVRGCTVVRNVGSATQTGEGVTLGGTNSCAWGTVFVKGGVFQDSTIAYNTAASAAGAYVLGSGRLSGCTVAFNHATMDRPLTVDAGSMINSENQPTAVANRIPVGGVVLAGSATVENCTIATNTADRAGSDQGLFVISGTVSGNTLGANGGDINTSASSSSVAYVVPDDGQAGVWPYDTPAKAARSVQAAVNAVAASRSAPGAVHLAAGDYRSPDNGWLLVLKRPVRVLGPDEGTARFLPTATSGKNGYGIWIGDKDASLDRVTVTGFKAYYEDAGVAGDTFTTAAGVLCRGTLSDVTLTGNLAEGYSATSALLMLGGTISGSTISVNLTNQHGGISQWGGGLRMYGGIVEDTLLSGNRAVGGAGAAVCGGGAVVRRCRFTGNTIDNTPTYTLNHGAGVYLTAGRLESCLIDGNTALTTTASHQGGGVYMTGGTLANCTVADNVHKAANGGAGVYQTSGTVTNSIVWANLADGVASDLVTAGGKAGLNWTESDPKFRSTTGTNPYRLAADSPCLGAGDAAFWTKTDTDLLGNPRVVRGTVNLGCYQERETGFSLLIR